MIELKNLFLGFQNQILLENVSTCFRSYQLTSILGRNGSGKSTMLKAICGLNKEYKGEILLNGMNEREISPRQKASLVSYVNTQRPRIANLKCYDIVALGRTPYTSWHGKLSPKDKNIIDEAFNLVGMAAYRMRVFNTLSDGESQKIMIARAIAQDTPYIILDEPTSFLDIPNRYEVVSLLKRLTRENDKTILFSTHELDIALEFSDNIALIRNKNLFNLTTSEMISSGLLDTMKRN